MQRIINITAKLFEKFPEIFQYKFFEWMLRYTPLFIISHLPISYGAYLKCAQGSNCRVVLDCGAHIGNCAILFSRMVGPTGIVISIEPFKDSYDQLVERIEKLNLNNVVAINKGLWKSSKILPLEKYQNTLSCHVCNRSDSDVFSNKNPIECVTIDNIVGALKLNRVDLIKMDIEGAEIEALQGASKTLSSERPRLAIASYHLRDEQPTYKQVEMIVTKYKYNVRTFFPPHLTTFGKPQ